VTGTNVTWGFRGGGRTTCRGKSRGDGWDRYTNSIEALAAHIKQPQFPELLRCFLYGQLNPGMEISPDDVPLDQCPAVNGRILVYHSAVARFFAPSDLCGAGGMYQERIHSNPNWNDEYSRYDTVFVETGAGQGAMKGLVIGRIRLFFSFVNDRKYYPCALVEWLIPLSDPDEDTRMWVVRPEFHGNG